MCREIWSFNLHNRQAKMRHKYKLHFHFDGLPTVRGLNVFDWHPYVPSRDVYRAVASANDSPVRENEATRHRITLPCVTNPETCCVGLCLVQRCSAKSILHAFQYGDFYDTRIENVQFEYYKIKTWGASEEFILIPGRMRRGAIYR